MARCQSVIALSVVRRSERTGAIREALQDRRQNRRAENDKTGANDAVAQLQAVRRGRQHLRRVDSFRAATPAERGEVGCAQSISHYDGVCAECDS